MKRNKSKSGKKSQDISVRSKVSDWVGDLHTEKKKKISSPAQNRLTSLLFSGILCILLALIIKISYEVKVFIKLSVCITESSAKASSC